MMALPRLPSWLPGRALVLTASILILGTLCAVVDGTARAQPQPKKADAPKTTTSLEGSDKVMEVVQLINSKLEEGWKANKLTPSKRCDDYEYIRRASIDIIGRTARPDEIVQYLKDPAETRRALLVERLLKSEEYARNWANIWANWLLTRSGVFGRGEYRDQMVLWLEDQFARNRPYHQIVKELITAQGDNKKNGAVNFLLAHVGEPVPQQKRGAEGQFEMVPITSRVTRLFLGIQTQCVQCHDHPFDNSLKQNMFWGVNAYLRQIERKGTPPMQMNRGQAAPALELVDNPATNTNAFVMYEKRNGIFLRLRAQFLDGTRISEDAAQPADADGKRPPVSGLARREELASRVIEHEMFGKSIVNRMWAHFFGRGFSMPLDDFNDQNPVSYPELLSELAAKYKHYAYDQKMLIRWLCNSNLYNMSPQANATNDKSDTDPYFSRMLLKALSPEELYESLLAATTPPGAEVERASAQKERREQWLNNLVTNFGDDEGNEVNFNGTVVQALMMMNGREINEAITRKDGTIASIVKRYNFEPSAKAIITSIANFMAARPPAARNDVLTPQEVARLLQGFPTLRNVIGDIYLATLNRPPSDKEVQKIVAAFPLYRGVRDKDPLAPYHDLFWALLNSSEFILNH